MPARPSTLAGPVPVHAASTRSRSGSLAGARRRGLHVAAALVLGLLLVPAAASATSPDRLDAARAEVRRLDARRAALVAERVELERRLDRLAAEIADLKARRDPGLFREPELDRRLKASLTLSGRIDAVTRELEAAVSDLAAAARRLLSDYDRALARAREAVEAHASDAPSETDAEAREAALARLALLEAERARVEAGLQRLAPDAPPLMAEGPAPADDPEALRAQADRLRDSADRLERTLAGLERRAETLRDRAALEEEMRDFLSETRFFDESDRTATRLAPLAAAGGGTGGPAGDGAQSPEQGDTPSYGDSGDWGGGAPVGEDGAEPPGTETFFRLEPVPGEAGGERLEAPAGPGEDAGLPAVEARIRHLRTLIERLDRRADGLEAQAGRVE